MTSHLAIYAVLLQSQIGGANGETGMDPNMWQSWGAAGLLVGAFWIAAKSVGGWASPLITRWVEAKSKKVEADARLAEDVLLHQVDRDKRLDRIETNVDDLANLWEKTMRVVSRNCGRNEPPDSDVIRRASGEKPGT
jgi:hypothetical protein